MNQLQQPTLNQDMVQAYQQAFQMAGLSGSKSADLLLAHNMDPACLRPYQLNDGRICVDRWDMQQNKYVVQQVGYNADPVNNATTFRKDAWLQFDQAVIAAARPRMKAWADIRAAGLTYTIPNGIGKTSLEYEEQSDIRRATISMDGLRRGDTDRAVYNPKTMPLPIIHKDFDFSIRQIQGSRNTASPLDTTNAALAGEKVAEEVERLTIGNALPIQYAAQQIPGMINFPGRLTKVMTPPVLASGAPNPAWSPELHIQELLEMRQQSKNAFHYGPWSVYHSPNWDVAYDQDYSANKGTNTLRSRIGEVEGFNTPMSLDYLDGWQVIMLQMSINVVRGVIGMEIVTVQWDSEGGFLRNYKVMCILLPQFRTDFYNRTGIVHGVATPA